MVQITLPVHPRSSLPSGQSNIRSHFQESWIQVLPLSHGEYLNGHCVEMGSMKDIDNYSCELNVP